MIRQIRNGLIWGVLLLNFTTVQAQDVDFAQFFTNPTYYNPAYVGLTKGMKVRFNYSRQWTGLTGNYHAYNFSADIADRNIPGAGGLGVIATSDQQGFGTLKTTMLGFIPSVRIPVNDFSVFQLGAMAALVSRQVDWSKLVFRDQLDPRLGNISPSSFNAPGSGPIMFPDFSVGGIYMMKTNNVVGTFGVAVHHVTQPNQSFLDNVAPLPRKWVAHMDFIIDFNRYGGFYGRARAFKLNPGVLYETQAQTRLLAFGTNAYMRNVYVGAWYQNEVFKTGSLSNIVWMAGLNVPFYTDTRMKIVYSFVMNISGTASFPGPSHELSLVFELDNAALINPYRMRRSVGSRRSTLECSPF